MTKKKFIKFLYATDCYLLYLLSGVLAAACVVAFYSFTAVFNFSTSDAGEFFGYVSSFVEGKSAEVLIVSYVLVLIGILFGFSIKRKSATSYTGMTYARPISIFGAIAFGGAFNIFVNMFVPEGNALSESAGFLLLLCVFLSPFVEEIMFRGILLKMFGGACGTFFANIITSALFAISHNSLDQIAYTFLLGIALGIVRISSTSLWSAIALHLSFNITGAVLATGYPVLSQHNVFMLVCVMIVSFFIACCCGRKNEKGKIKYES